MSGTPRETLGAGVTLGPYTILAKRGEGGMGAVYCAHDSRLGREVALKVLPAGVTTDAVRLARFAREARAIAALNHPHIVTIYSTEEIDGVRFITMELVEGQTLDAVIPAGGVPLARFFDLAQPIADALSAAHEKQITHRDLKPNNVMVSSDGRVKVLDFGLARVDDPQVDEAVTPTETVLTREGIVGTMPYMSPEQIEGRTVDHRSDLFSLGVVFYEMLTGTRPFRARSSAALISMILRDTPVPLADQRPDVPPPLARLVARCLEKRPDERIQTARDVHDELKEIRRRVDSQWPSGVSVRRRDATALTVAVLPFSARSGDAESAALAEGLTDDIATGLSRFAHLRVLARDAAARLGRGASPQGTDVAPTARYLLEGGVRRSPSIVRISVRLVQTDTGTNLWADQLDVSAATDLFTLQDDVASRVVATVGDTSGVLARSMAATLVDVPLDELTVPELVLRFYAYVEHFRPEEHARLRDAAERAVAREPHSAQAWACLSRLYENEYSHQLNPRPDPLSRMRHAAERAVELDPQHQGAWMALASVHLFARDLAALRGAVERAVSLNPLDADAMALCGIFLGSAGDTDRSAALARRAATLNRQHPGWYHFPTFTAHYGSGEYEDALSEAKLINMPLLPVSHLAGFSAAGQLGRVGEARVAAEGASRVNPALLDADVARVVWTRWLWDQGLVTALLDGHRKANALLDAPAASSEGDS